MTEASLRSVTEWMVSFVDSGNDYGAYPELRLCMEFAHSDGEVVVVDDAGEHRLGDPVYEDAFLAVLRRLVVDGEILFQPADHEQKLACEAWMQPDAGDVATRAAVLDVPLKCRERPKQEPEPVPAQRAGDHLLELLKSEGAITYDRFYDGSDELDEELQKLFGLDENESPAILMDEVIFQIRKAGLVNTRELADKLTDGENNYQIELTPQGKVFVESGQKFRFRDVELC